MSNIFTELKKRKVFNTAAIYLATSFIILQAAGILVPALHIPAWTISFIVMLIILGFPVMLIFSWIYDISDEGIVKTKSSKSPSAADPQVPAMAKSSILGIIASIIITIIMIYKGVDYFTSFQPKSNKTSIAVLNFDNIRKFQKYDWLGERIAGHLNYKLGEISKIRIIDKLQILNKLGEIDPEKASILDYKINQIANNMDVDLILHGQFTLMDSIIEVTAFFADITNSGTTIPLMLEIYPLTELPNIPTYINNKISSFIKTNKRFKSDTE